VLFTEAASSIEGVDVVFSDELRANIQKAVNSNCNNLDAQCVDSVSNLLVNLHTELESRQVAIAVAGAELFVLIAIAIPLWGKGRNEGVPVALHIPSAQLDPAASAAQASAVAVIANSAAPSITINRKPEVTPVKGYVCVTYIRYAIQFHC
jgi:hypothetical protein